MRAFSIRAYRKDDGRGSYPYLVGRIETHYESKDMVPHEVVAEFARKCAEIYEKGAFQLDHDGGTWIPPHNISRLHLKEIVGQRREVEVRIK
jgi:hypothetical protein